MSNSIGSSYMKWIDVFLVIDVNSLGRVKMGVGGLRWVWVG